jgi:hypothetical protein
LRACLHDAHIEHSAAGSAALYSGAIHPTAEAQAIVVDHVLPHVRRILDPSLLCRRAVCAKPYRRRCRGGDIPFCSQKPPRPDTVA